MQRRSSVRLVADVSALRRNPPFRRLWFGQLVSSNGNQLTVVAVAYQTFRITHSSLAVGLVSLAQLPPLIAGSQLGGALADAHDRRRVLIATQILSALASTGLALNAISAHAHLWPLFACTAAAAGLQATDQAARRAVLPMLVPKAELTSAVALQTVLMTTSMVGGAALGGALVGTLGLFWVYSIDAASFGASLAAAATLPRLVPGGGGTPAGIGSIIEGFGFLRRSRMLLASYLIDIDAMVFGMPKAVFPALGTVVFRGGAPAVGLLFAAPGVGALIGSVLTGWVSRVQYQGRAVVLAVGVWGLAIAAVGVAPTLWVALGLLAVAGAADSVSAVFRSSIQQHITPERLQGRLSGTYFAVVAGGPRLGDLETGTVAALWGPEVSLWSGGLACLVGAAFLVWRFPELWRSRIPAGFDHEPAPESPAVPDLLPKIADSTNNC